VLGAPAAEPDVPPALSKPVLPDAPGLPAVPTLPGAPDEALAEPALSELLPALALAPPEPSGDSPTAPLSHEGKSNALSAT
jgi:hypothetical protein